MQPYLSSGLRGLIDEMLNGTISAEGVKQLEAALDGNHTAQQFFRDYCQLHINLDAEMRAQRVVNSFADRENGLFSVPSLTANDRLRPVEGSSVGVGRNWLQRSRFRRWAAVAFAAAGAVFIAFSLLALRPVEQAGVAPRPRAAGVGGNAEIMARVQLASSETRFIPLGEIGHVMLEGPADMEFINPMRARLNRGRIKLRITSKQGRGYVVETPHGEVKDLGTEFGIDASQESSSGVVVFEGAVDLSVPKADGRKGAMQIERLVQGEGLTFSRRGRLSRIMSIITGDNATFERGGDTHLQRRDPIIANVTDNIQESDLKKFYEIVPGGLEEDARTYVDRPNHEWNGIDERGIPSYLQGADYVKTFNNDKMREDVEIQLTLCRPAKLYVLLDVRVAPPEWLVSAFHETGDQIGLDIGSYFDSVNNQNVNCLRASGPGNSIDERFSIWERIVSSPGVIKLGPNAGGTWGCGMYGIAAVGFGGGEPQAIDGIAEPLRIVSDQSIRIPFTHLVDAFFKHPE